LLSFVATHGILLAMIPANAQEQEQYEQPPINYSKAVPHDCVANVITELQRGSVKVGPDGRRDLQTFLARLKVPIESQVLVFSKTSFQRHRISPDRPRALYFNDNCYIGWVPGGLIELTAIDPVIGPVFYSFDPAVASTNCPKSITRDNDCLRCHGGTFVNGIPGVFARSVFPDSDGEPLLRFGSEIVDFRTPFTNRWGGWYVTGTHGTATHRGNIFASANGDKLEVNFLRGANVTNLSSFFETGKYLANSSDIIALLVLEQQLAIQNTLTRASLDSRRMLDYQKNLQIAFKAPITEEPAYDSVKSVFDSTAKRIVDDFLFKDEATLPTRLAGSAAFQKAFVSSAVKAKNGGSLKDIDLHGHIFRNRCSYLIYSESFRSLPAALKNRVYARMSRALANNKREPDYAYIGEGERKRILAILRDTAPDIYVGITAGSIASRSNSNG
jgi:hypothetical protein